MEWMAVESAVDWLESSKYDDSNYVVIYTDSETVYRQFNKKSKLVYGARHYSAAIKTINKILKSQCKIVLEWIPRERNPAGKIVEDAMSLIKTTTPTNSAF